MQRSVPSSSLNSLVASALRKNYASMEITFQRDLNFPHHEPSIIIITIEEEKRENGNEYNIQYTRTLYGIDNREQSHNISSVYDYVLYFIII